MNSPIKDKFFRNVFEHYDNEIQKWARSSTKKNYKDMNITINGFSAAPDVEVIDAMRNLDVSRDGKTVTLTFQGDSYRLSDTELATEELVEKAGKVRPSLW